MDKFCESDKGWSHYPYCTDNETLVYLIFFQTDSRIEHVRERHEGEVHQADPEEGVEVREQVRQVAGEGR
jgi:hypothetical protein